MPRRWLNRVLLLLIVLLIAAAIVYAFMPQPVDVELAAVTRGELRVTVDDDGETRVRERYTVSAPLAGRLRRIDLDVGDAVSAGQRLAVIDPPATELLDARTRASAEAAVSAAQASVNHAEASLAEAETQRDLAEYELDRTQEMFESNAANRREVDTARFQAQIRERQVEAAAFAVETARFELEQARAALAHVQDDSAEAGEPFALRAPVDGRVLQVFEESATAVTPGQAIIEVGDPSALELVVDVLSTDAVQIAPEDAAIIDHWGGEETLQAVVRDVEPQAFTEVSALGVEEQRVNVILDLLTPADQWRQLGDGYRVEARIVVWEADNVLKVPTGALFREDGDWAVFTVRDDRAQLQRVRTGRSTGSETQILDGLDEGDVVIAHPSDRVADGVAIQTR